MQNFIRNSDQQQFEFQHFPTSYLRLAAHRVAQHYGLVTMVQDKCLDGQGTIIVVKKMAPSKYPAVCLSEVPVKQSESDKLEQKKIVIRPRPSKESSNGGSELGKRNSIRTVEERKEEYERARARIFSGPNSPQSEDPASQAPVGGNTVCYNVDDSIGTEDSVMDLEKNFSGRDGGSSSRVAILRDIEKDRTDPDYDRSYERYELYHNHISFTHSLSFLNDMLSPSRIIFISFVRLYIDFGVISHLLYPLYAFLCVTIYLQYWKSTDCSSKPFQLHLNAFW